MALTIQRKKQIVEHVHHRAQEGLTLVAAEYTGLTVSKMTDLRNQARSQGLFLKVVKNSLARKAFEGTAFVGANDRLVGQLVYFIGNDEPGKAARLARDFAKTSDNLKIRVLAIGSEIYGPQHLDAVASLPNKEQAISQFMSCLQAPITKFVRTLAALEDKMSENTNTISS